MGGFAPLYGLIMKQKSISAENTFTAAKEVYGVCDLSIDGTWEGTLTLQRSFNEGTTWKDVDTFKANIESYFVEHRPNVLYRIGFKSGDYTSGTTDVILY